MRRVLATNLRRLADFRRYLTVGGLAALTDFAAFTLLARGLGLHPVAANAVSRPLGGLCGFVGNRQWTFRGRSRSPWPWQLARFGVAWWLSFALTELLLWLFHDGLAWEPVLSKLAAEALAVILNFLLQKHWTFRP